MKRLLAIVLLLCAPLLLPAQQQTILNPDCALNFTFTASGQFTPSSSVNCTHNLSGILEWTMTYQSQGFSVVSILVQSAPDSAGSPGTWAPFVGTTSAGTNPLTSLTGGYVQLKGYNPWNRVFLTTGTGVGLITGTLYGCRQPGCGGSAANLLPTLFYQTVQQAGVSLPQEPILNFPSNVTCVDNPGNTSTDCTPAAAATLSAARPYLTDGTHFYVAANGYQATRPSSSPTWLNGVTPGTVTAGANGDLYLAGAGAYWAVLAGSASVEAEFSWVNTTNTGVGSAPNAGVWLYDNTNGVVWKLYLGISTNIATAGSSFIGLDKYTCVSPCTATNPAYSATPVEYDFPSGSAPVHLKMSVTAGTLSLFASVDGGATFTTFAQTEAVGVITKGGYAFLAGTMTVLSVVVA